MISIAICDDEQEALDELKQMLNAFFKNTSVRISLFSSANELISAAAEGGFDIYILDVIMPELNGIELGMKLRQNGDSGVIIYLTSSPEYAVMSYDTGAFFYLLKPVDNDKLQTILSRSVKEIEGRRKQGIAVKMSDGIKFLRFDDIMYAELKERAVCYTLGDGSHVRGQCLRVPFREACSALLKDNRFVLCGASFCVNLSFVKAIEKNFIVFKNDARLSLPQKAVVNFNTQWLDFWLEERK